MTLPPDQLEQHCRDGFIWMPGSTRIDRFYSSLMGGSSDYKEHWRDWVLGEYLDKISVWRCQLENHELSVILESQIQLAFRSHFGLSYYRNLGVQSWLGRVEVPDQSLLSSVRFEFAELPDVEPDSERVLTVLRTGGPA